MIDSCHNKLFANQYPVIISQALAGERQWACIIIIYKKKFLIVIG